MITKVNAAGGIVHIWAWGYEQRLKLAQRRRDYLVSAYDKHNRKFSDSAGTFYAAAQASTDTTTHGPYQGNNDTQTMFGLPGEHATKGLQWLQSAAKDITGTNEQ